MRFTSFSFTLCPSPEEEQTLLRHAGAARFAYNQGLALLNEAYKRRKQDLAVHVPYSGFDLINAFNAWKRSPQAGVAADGTPGLPWRGEVLAQVFEEGLVDLGRGIKAFFDARKQGKRRPGFPVFKKRQRSKPSFRIRNKKNDVRIGIDSIRLPKLGDLAVRESTRSLRRMLRPGKAGEARAKVLFATVTKTADRWHLRVNVEAAAFHPALQHTEADKACPALGIDRGLLTFAVGATADGTERLRVDSPKPLNTRLRALRRASRALTRRRKKESLRRQIARRRLGRLHARIACIRKHFVHTLSSRVVKTHAHVALEDLHVAGMLQNRRLSRSISDAGWGLFATQVAYKATWYNSRVTLVDRFFPSSKRCHGCGHTVAELPLWERLFECPACRLSCDRDTNAAANCAQFAEQKNVAAKRAETQNDRGGARQWPRPSGCGETGFGEAITAGLCARSTPGKGGVGLNVNAL